MVRCFHCDRFQYNAPKHERGLAPKPMRVDGIKPSTRYRVSERAHFQCEFCGRRAGPESFLVVGHRVSEKDCRQLGLPDTAVRDIENLAWICAECNAGMGGKSIEIHDALVMKWRKRLENVDSVEG